MLKKLVLLSAVPLALLTIVQPAEARRLFWWETLNSDVPPPPDYYDPQQDAYGDPYAQDQFNRRQYEAYRREMARRYGNASYYQDPGPDYGYDAPPPPYADPLYPPARKKVKHKFLAAKPIAKPVSKPKITNSVAVAAPGANDGMVTGSTAQAATTQTPLATTKPKSGGAVTCDKGQGIVSSFGFSNVASKSCDAKTLVYSAERGGNRFEVEVNSVNGELTAVKKL